MNLDGLTKFLNRFRNNLSKYTTHELLEMAGEYGVQYAKLLVRNVDTGATVDSINYKVEGNKLTIEAGGNAVWLEFGTGIARNPSEYPVQVEGIVGHGQYGEGKGSNPQGWYYATDDPSLAVFDREGHYWMNSDGTYIAHTMGIEQNMFMWKTVEELERKMPEWGLEIINKGLDQ